MSKCKELALTREIMDMEKMFSGKTGNGFYMTKRAIRELMNGVEIATVTRYGGMMGSGSVTDDMMAYLGLGE